MKCSKCGKDYKLIYYTRLGYGPGNRYVPDCECDQKRDGPEE